jgi:hypothetical protein
MTKTRSQTQKHKSKVQLYRARVKSSTCRKLTNSRCIRKNSCKFTRKGRRKSYCRKKKNTK